ncbi:glycosyltransferase [Verrucomicrobiota bacterium]
MEKSIGDISSIKSPKGPRLVFGHLAWADYALSHYNGVVERAREMGWDVEAFCLVPDPPEHRMTFPMLDRLWQRRDRRIVALRDRLAAKLADADVFWNFNGSNVHPEWLKDFSTLNVYGFFDDPESTDEHSRPTARYYDAAFVGNLSCLPLYFSWGMEHVAWSPLAFIGDRHYKGLTTDSILQEDRPIDVMFCGERVSSFRHDRFDILVKAFPDARFYGRGWPNGYISDIERQDLYRRTKIGWNIHNSIGPVNQRLFDLPAAGVMQICDNRCRLGQAFSLGKEVVGFDTIEECIELTRYYLDHDEERRIIASNGFNRYRNEYTESSLWEYYYKHFSEWLDLKRKGEITKHFFQRPRVAVSTKTTALGHRLLNRCLDRMNLRLLRKDICQASLQRLEIDHHYCSPILLSQSSEEGLWPDLTEMETRIKEGHPPEDPSIVALNWAVASITGRVNRIVEIGGKAGCFAYEAGSDSGVEIVSVETNPTLHAWAKDYRSRPNIKYVSSFVSPEDAQFDLLVSVDMIEYISDYREFLESCLKLAPKAVLTAFTRSQMPAAFVTHSENHGQNSRKWTPGEFYWILKTFYTSVVLYGMTDPFIPACKPVQITDESNLVIAVCS